MGLFFDAVRSRGVSILRLIWNGFEVVLKILNNGLHKRRRSMRHIVSPCNSIAYLKTTELCPLKTRPLLKEDNAYSKKYVMCTILAHILKFNMLHFITTSGPTEYCNLLIKKTTSPFLKSEWHDGQNFWLRAL